MSDMPRVTFGIIVLNGEPFTRYCLRALQPFAHEIIVVEGGFRGPEMRTDLGRLLQCTEQQPLMGFLIINTDYRAFLRWLCDQHPGLE